MIDDELVSIAVAADAAGVSDRNVRRWVRDGHVPAVSAPGGRLVRLADVVGYAEQRRTAAQVSAGRPVSAEVSGGQDAVRPSVSAEAITAIVAPIVAELGEARATIERQAATIQQQAEELGTLRERLRVLEAPQAPVAPPTASMPTAAEMEGTTAPDDLWTQVAAKTALGADVPPPRRTARPELSWGQRLRRWLRR